MTKEAVSLKLEYSLKKKLEDMAHSGRRTVEKQTLYIIEDALQVFEYNTIKNEEMYDENENDDPVGTGCIGRAGRLCGGTG